LSPLMLARRGWARSPSLKSDPSAYMTEDSEVMAIF